MQLAIELIFCDKMKILALHLRNFIDYAQVRGIGAGKLAAILAVLPVGWTKDNATLSAGDFYKALKSIDQEIQDEFLGIKCGQFISLKLLGLIYQISLQATTIEEAFHYLGSYLAATMPIVSAETSVSDELAEVKLTIDSPEKICNRIILENCQTIIAKELKMMTAHNLEVKLGTPYYHEGYPAGWYLAPDFHVSFSPAILKSNLKDQQQLHLDVLVPEYLKMVEYLKAGDSFADKIKTIMLSMADPKLPDINAVSDAMHFTPRTLQRRLAQENLTFREIVEDLKKKICSFLMWHDAYSISSLSYILGYSEPASFIHSFKKWHGDPPVLFRKKLKYADLK